MSRSFFNSIDRSTSMPTGAPTHVPRRSSYADVVSGTAPASNSAQPQAATAFHEFTRFLNTGQQAAHDPAAMDESGNNDEGGEADAWIEHRLPGYSRRYQPLFDSWSQDRNAVENINSFFIPSYLRGSRYAEKLENNQRMKARDAAAKAKKRAKDSSSSGSHSISSTGVFGAAKKAPSYHGVVLDIVEKPPPDYLHGASPLPSRLNIHDEKKHTSIEVLADGLEMKLATIPPASEALTAHDRKNEVYSIRADRPIPQEAGIYYFEVTVLTRKNVEPAHIGIGFVAEHTPIVKPIGWDPYSWGYHGDDGLSYSCKSTGVKYGPSYGVTNDIIGCGVNFSDGTAFYTKNGIHLGIAFRGLNEKSGKLFPTVGVRKKDEHLRVNFGQKPFTYDIDGYVSKMKRDITARISETSTAKLAPPLDETSLVQNLVLQYLAHDVYIDTAHVFAEEVREERRALSVDASNQALSFDFTENVDAKHRQKCRASIMDGDVEMALVIVRTFYPSVLQNSRQTYFHLRIQQFIELIRKDAKARNSAQNGTLKGKGKAPNGNENMVKLDYNVMELDSHDCESLDDRMDTDEPNSNGTSNSNFGSIEDSIAFGQEIQKEFQIDTDPTMQRDLQDAFALLAYPDPENEESVGWLLKQSKREKLAEELNSAILVSMGKPPAAALEKVIQQTTVLIEILAEQKPFGNSANLINIKDYMRPPRPLWTPPE